MKLNINTPHLPKLEKYRLPPGMKSCDLAPNQNLSTPERLLQYNLLKQIENFETMASQLDKLDKLDQYKQMWSEAMTECFNQIYNKYLHGEKSMINKLDYPSESSFIAASNLLNIDIKVIKSFAKVESGIHGAFLDNGEPVILYERHVFRRLTKHKYDIRNPININGEFYFLSHPSAGGYGPIGIQHAKLQAAALLNRDAALKSCSWGLFQLMGLNYSLCGHSTLQSFINAMYNHVDDHLTAFCHFVMNNKKKVRGKLLIEALRSTPPDYEVASLIYNGPKAFKNGYHIKFRKSYEGLV